MSENPSHQKPTIDKILSYGDRMDGNLWKGDPAVEQRVELAYNFYTMQAGFTPEETISHMRGIRFDKDVTIETLPPGTFVKQYQTPEANAAGKTGNYFTFLDTNSSELGIEGISTSTQNRVPEIYQTTTETQVLRSEAAHTSHWKTGELLEGGGTQFFMSATNQVEPFFSRPNNPATTPNEPTDAGPDAHPTGNATGDAMNEDNPAATSTNNDGKVNPSTNPVPAEGQSKSELLEDPANGSTSISGLAAQPPEPLAESSQEPVPQISQPFTGIDISSELDSPTSTANAPPTDISLDLSSVSSTANAPPTDISLDLSSVSSTANAPSTDASSASSSAASPTDSTVDL